jgi:hypothetical protein
VKAIAAPAALGFALLPAWPSVARHYAFPGGQQRQAAQAAFQKAGLGPQRLCNAPDAYAVRQAVGP